MLDGGRDLAGVACQDDAAVGRERSRRAVGAAPLEARRGDAAVAEHRIKGPAGGQRHHDEPVELVLARAGCSRYDEEPSVGATQDLQQLRHYGRRFDVSDAAGAERRIQRAVCVQLRQHDPP
jgi:hypothetical protein